MSDHTPDWVPDDVDVDTPSAARMYDYLLGGAYNFVSDRAAADQLVKSQPQIRGLVKRNRAYLQRVVRFMVDNGVHQFLDLGSGIPTVGNVHEVAQSMFPGARVVYVDIDKIAYVHSALMLRDNKDADIVLGDAIQVDEVLNDSVTRELLDFTQPVGILAMTFGHFIPDHADPARVFARYRDAVPPGSYLGLSHLTDDFAVVDNDKVKATVSKAQINLFPRTHDEILAFFDGYELVEPGLVTTSQWHPEGGLTAATDPGEDDAWAGVGRKR